MGILSCSYVLGLYQKLNKNDTFKFHGWTNVGNSVAEAMYSWWSKVGLRLHKKNTYVITKPKRNEGIAKFLSNELYRKRIHLVSFLQGFVGFVLLYLEERVQV